MRLYRDDDKITHVRYEIRGLLLICGKDILHVSMSDALCLEFITCLRCLGILQAGRENGERW